MGGVGSGASSVERYTPERQTNEISEGVPNQHDHLGIENQAVGKEDRNVQLPSVINYKNIMNNTIQNDSSNKNVMKNQSLLRKNFEQLA